MSMILRPAFAATKAVRPRHPLPRPTGRLHHKVSRPKGLAD